MKSQIVAILLIKFGPSSLKTLLCFLGVLCVLNVLLFLDEQIEMIYKIVAHMAANDRALIAEGSCGSPRSIKVFLGECNVDELYA